MEDRPCTEDWHYAAKYLHKMGKTTREIAKIVGKHRETVRLQLNPYSRAKVLANQRRKYAEREDVRERCAKKSRRWFENNRANRKSVDGGDQHV
jgi:transposase